MILRNCRLIPELCEGFQETKADIRIDGNSIVEILPAGTANVDEEIIDCTGKTVLPGLFNIHTHLYVDTFDNNLIEKPDGDPAIHMMNAIHYAQTLLSYGYTSIRDVGTAGNAANKLRDCVNAGKIVGPDIKACGDILTPDMVSPPLCYSSLVSNPINSPYEMRAAVRRRIMEGADFIKILGMSATGGDGPRGGEPMFYPDETEELVNTVKREGSYIAVHTVSPESNAMAIENEVHSIEHGMMLSKENIEQIIAHGLKSSIVPTTALFLLWFGPDFVKFSHENIYPAYEAGVLLGWGTDCSLELFLQNPKAEFFCRKELLGFPMIEVLKQATINSAIINKTDDLRGSIKVGKRADFAIFNGNPDEDLTLFDKPCACVIKDGRIVARDGMVLC